MIATERPNCPVKSFVKYLSLLNPKLDSLFQRPKKQIQPSSSFWYDNMVLGEKTLNEYDEEN